VTEDTQKSDERTGLIAAIEKAFDATPAPQSITDCDCLWCRDVVADFSGRLWPEMEDARIKANYSSLASLSPQAFHYFLPAYLRHSLKHFNLNSEVCEYTVYAVAPNAEVMKDSSAIERMRERLRHFDRKQAEIILHFLELVAGDAELSDYHTDTGECISNLKGLMRDLNLLD
jgi:Family of unknown function (DUF6714)